MKTITSKSNPLFKNALKIVKNRQKHPECFVVEGKKLVGEALAAGATPQTVFTNDELPADLEAKLQIPAIRLSNQLFLELSTFVTPGQVLCIFQQPTPPALESLLMTAKMLLILDRIQDPGNLGTIVRTSEALGADAVILLKDSVSPCNNKVTRSAMGSSFRLPIYANQDFFKLKQLLNTHNFALISTEMKGEKLFNFAFPHRCALILGQEGNGILPEIKKECIMKLAIPMQGQVESLNVAASAAICLYEWARQQSRL